MLIQRKGMMEEIVLLLCETINSDEHCRYPECPTGPASGKYSEENQPSQAQGDRPVLMQSNPIYCQVKGVTYLSLKEEK